MRPSVDALSGEYAEEQTRGPCGRIETPGPLQTADRQGGHTSSGGILSMTANGVEVEDAVHCGLCHPEYHRTV
jgi:hypothetical protein